MAARSVTLGLSLAQRGTVPARPLAAAETASATPSALWANMLRRSSTLGQEILASTATTPSVPGRPDATASAMAAAAWR